MNTQRLITPPSSHFLKAFGGLVLLTASLAGCQPTLDSDEYGELIYQLPQVKGAEKPYELQQLKPIDAEKESEK